MKHLIARHSEFYAIGLKDRAYVVFDTPGNDAPMGSIIELLPSTDPKTIQQSAPPSSTTPATTLDPSSSPKTTSNPTTSDDINNKQQNPQKNYIDKVHDRQKSAEEQMNEICAVAIISDYNESSDTIILRCAVARNNKSLDIYTVKLEKKLLPKTSSQSPSLHYRTPKRVSCFAFANIDATTSESSSISSTNKAPLLLSGDVAGDSHAYNLLEKGQRLLLGHTASMLTDIAIVNGDGESKSSLLLTADRDEKIRISRFPEAQVIEGFLLGHTAYVTGFVVLPSSSSALAVSCGGDMTLRLWDLTAHNEISSTTTVAADSNEMSDEKENTNEIPTAIAASCCGRIVAVIFDDSRRLSIFKITPTSLELLGNVECPSQPLSINFTSTALTVLMKDPDYIAIYDIKHDNEDIAKPIAVLRNEIRVMQALRNIASDKNIAMPNTILEKDDHGNPVIRKENETRGPAATEAPWNRVERIEIAKEREKRRTKKKQKLANDS
jgi:WD40 repeat protein